MLLILGDDDRISLVQHSRCRRQMECDAMHARCLHSKQVGHYTKEGLLIGAI